jgi:chromosomal replication initiator protein
MVSDYNQNLWKAALQELKNIVPERHYNLWLKDTELVSLSGGVARIYFANDMVCAKVLEKHLQDIEKTIFKCTGNNYQLEAVSLGKENQSFFDFTDNASLPPSSFRPPELPVTIRSLELKKEYTFDNFVVDTSNQLAYTAARAVAKTPGQSYNPLFIHGGAGLGKTHLMQAICHELLRHHAEPTILYMACEDFVNEYIHATDAGDMEGFRYKYRHMFVLLLDDVHFLVRRDRSQEEFFHTFNSLYNMQKQIVLSSDSSPSDIKELRDRLTSRFKWGVVANIQPPSFDMRVTIIKRRSKAKGHELAADVIQYIAEQIVSNIRELEGAVTNIFLLADMHHQERITLEFTKCMLATGSGMKLTQAPPSFHLGQILTSVAQYFQLTSGELQSDERRKSLVLPRHLFMYFAKKLTPHSLHEIGAFLGNRDHSTVLHGFEKVSQSRTEDLNIKKIVEELEEQLVYLKNAALPGEDGVE